MDGTVYAMAGASRRHNLATTNLATELNLALRETDCEVYASDLRVRIRAGHYVYPDVSVACGGIEMTDGELTLCNPLVVFEVLSKKTEGRDRGDKAEDYFRLASLRDYILVSQYRVRVEHFTRQKNNEWTLKIYESVDDVLVLESIGCRLPVGYIYRKINFPPLRLVGRKKQNGKKPD